MNDHSSPVSGFYVWSSAGQKSGQLFAVADNFLYMSDFCKVWALFLLVLVVLGWWGCLSKMWYVGCICWSTDFSLIHSRCARIKPLYTWTRTSGFAHQDTFANVLRIFTALRAFAAMWFTWSLHVNLVSNIIPQYSKFGLLIISTSFIFTTTVEWSLFPQSKMHSCDYC